MVPVLPPSTSQVLHEACDKKEAPVILEAHRQIDIFWLVVFAAWRLCEAGHI
jgi:hypothetical protein